MGVAGRMMSMDDLPESAYITVFEKLREAFGLFEAPEKADAAVRDWILIDANPAFYRLVGQTREAALGTGAERLFDDPSATFGEIFNHLDAAGGSDQRDFRLAGGYPGAWRAFRAGPALVALLCLPDPGPTAGGAG